MGILDDLKQEANKAREKQQTEAERRAELEAYYDARIKPTMLSLLGYLNEMIEQLEVIGMQIPVSYELPAVGQVHDLKQTGYRVNIDSGERPKKLGLLFHCEAPKEQTYDVMPQPKADEFRTFLETNRALYMEAPIRDHRNKPVGASFRGKVRICVRLLFQADIGRQRLEFISSNFEGLKTARFSFDFNTVDEKWMDQLGHYILRKDTRLGRFDLSESYRRQLQEQVLAEQAKRHAEIGGQDSAGSSAVTDTGFFDQVRKTLTTPIGKPRS